MDYTEGSYPILRKTRLAEDVFDLTVHAPDIAAKAAPGQFVHIKCEPFFLRRPISICDADEKTGTLRLIFEIRGQGTEALAQKEEGESLGIMGPLGKGFSTDKNSRALLMGGGIGVPPLLMAARYFAPGSVVSLGFRKLDKVILAQDFEALGCKVLLSTDDGSKGLRGNAVEAVADLPDQFDVICACGPTPMLRGAVAFAKQENIPCQVSLEGRMACGVGACLGCACKTKGQDGREHNLHVCKNGPVFDAGEVIL